MFEHPPVNGAEEYEVQVTLAEKDEAFKYPLFNRRDSSTAVMLSNLEFGNKYIWRYTGLHDGNEMKWNGPYNFETLYDDYVNRNHYRVSVLVNDSLKSEGGLITLDLAHTIIDRTGNFVWFLPPDTTAQKILEREVPDVQRKVIGDLRITPFGTVTLLHAAEDEERDLNGNILWQAPKQTFAALDSSHRDLDYRKPYQYHHCFKKLSSGNYMVLDRELVSGPMPITRTGSALSRPISVNAKALVGNETIKEFDRYGNLIWSWSSDNYFDANEWSRMMQSKPDSGLLHLEPGGHMNAFDVDEKNGFVYAGFRNINRVIKIDKKSKQVVCAWGTGMTWKGAPNGDGFFSKQHETTLLRDGSIAVFSNGFIGNGDYVPNTFANREAPASSVVIFSQPAENKSSKILWKFDCRLDTNDNVSLTGGSVDELKNGNLLVGMGYVNRAFEITRGKRIVWSCLIEKYNQTTSLWERFPVYRVHYTSSLYPCYFTVQSNIDKLNRTLSSFQLKIFNDGTEDDSYEINVSSSTGYYDKRFETPILTVGKSASFEIAPNILPKSNDDVKVVVTSKTNPDFTRIINIKYDLR